MHVDIIPNRKSKPCVLLRETYRENGKVRHRTLLNISDLPIERAMAVKRALQGDFDDAALSGKLPFTTRQGPKFGALYALCRIAQDIGLMDVLGTDKMGKLALLMIVGQIIFGKSRLALVDWASDQAVSDVLGIGGADGPGFNEKDLYKVLDHLCDMRYEIETKFFNKRGKKCKDLFLYDVTSSYLEGQFNELGCWGYNRDKKKGKKQIVVGLLTDQDGDPVGVDVFEGNTSDPKTVIDQVTRLADRFGVKNVVFVGDRGMLKSGPIESIKQANFHYITAITKPQIESLMKQGVLQLSIFDETLGEISHEGLRYVFRRNPVRAAELEESRQQRIKKAQDYALQLSDRLAASNRCRVDVALKNVHKKLVSLKIDRFVQVEPQDRTIVIQTNEHALLEMSRLDGVYVLKTDTNASDLDKETVHKVYKNLTNVERDFRSMKTDLNIRPVFVRKDRRTRGHVLVVMLALALTKEMQRRLEPIAIEVHRAVETLDGWTVLQECISNIHFNRLPIPTQRQQEILAAISIKQPTSLPVYSNNRNKIK
jgi:transposase